MKKKIAFQAPSSKYFRLKGLMYIN